MLNKWKTPLFIGSILHYYKFSAHQQFAKLSKLLWNCQTITCFTNSFGFIFAWFHPHASSIFPILRLESYACQKVVLTFQQFSTLVKSCPNLSQLLTNHHPQCNPSIKIQNGCVASTTYVPKIWDQANRSS